MAKYENSNNKQAYVNNLDKLLDLKREFKDWDSLSDEALNDFEKIVLEARRKGYSIRKVAESTGIPYAKVLSVLSKTQLDEGLYPTEETE